MTETVGRKSWEETLDRELADLFPPGSREPGVDPVHPAAAVAAPPSADRQISVNQLRLEVFDSVQSGLTLPEDIYDEAGMLLLAAGSHVTRRFLQLLRDRGVTRVHLRSSTPGSSEVLAPPAVEVETPAEDLLHTDASRQLDERLAGELQRRIDFYPVKGWRRPRLSIDDLKAEASRGVERHAATSVVVADLTEALQTGRRVSAPQIRESISNFVDKAAVDFDLLPLIVAMQESKTEYLYDHCVNVSLVAMAMASQLGLPRDSVTEIGLGGILQDIGMLRVPDSIRLGEGALGEREWQEVHRHPLHSLDMLADLRGIPQTVRLMVYQAHERSDGGGYPRGRVAGQLHEFSKIIALADVYSAMTSRRPYRPAMQPYEAIKMILQDGAVDRFDRNLIRALLDTISLFPTGSRVGLSNGSGARVLRANPGLHTRPVVEELCEDGTPTGHILDLSRDDTPRVVTAC